MNRKQFIQICNQNLKLVRNEFSFNQDKMAMTLGLSKKTLVEIEKGRSSLGWAGSVVLCTLFAQSQILTNAFGDKHGEIILTIAFEGTEPDYPQTRGGTIWWETIKENSEYTIQQNIISQHYRLLNSEGKRIGSSLDLEDLMETFSGKS